MIPLATKLFGSQLGTGRQARPQPYGARRAAVRSLRVALAIKILSPPPLFSLLSRARLFLDLLAPSTCTRSTACQLLPLSPVSVSPSHRLFQYSTRYCVGN